MAQKETTEVAAEANAETVAETTNEQAETSADVQDETQSDNTQSDDSQTDDAQSETQDAVAPKANDGAFYGNAGGQSELSDALSVKTDDSAPRREVEGGRAYEIIYIARIGDAEATEATSTRLRTQIENAGGAIDNVRATETRRLAYEIGGENEGVYMVVNARLIPTQLPELDRFFKLEESVLRHMVLKESGR